ncbi:MAG: hypothetical protein ACXACH_08190, partial [Candidatus Hermodarchaeia archaeon]
MPNRDSTSTNTNSPSSIETLSTRSTTVKPASFMETEYIQTRLVLINQAVTDYIQTQKGEPEVLYNAANHLIAAGGKRLRSLVTLLCCEAVG